MNEFPEPSQPWPEIPASLSEASPSLRDLFAAAALHGLLADGFGLTEKDIASAAYKFADAMLEVRSESKKMK